MPKTSRPPDFVVPRAALMAWAFSFKGESRPELQVIHFEPRMEGPRKDRSISIHTVATNGHHLLHLWWPTQRSDVLDDPFEVESEAVGEFLDELNGGKGSPFSRGRGFGFRIKTEGPDYVVVASKGEEEPVWMEIGVIEHDRGEFPKWQEVIPSHDGEAPKSFGVNFEYVLDFHRFLKEFGHGSSIELHCAGVPKGPLTFRPAVTNDEGFEVEMLLLDQATAVEYILMPLAP